MNEQNHGHYKGWLARARQAALLGAFAGLVGTGCGSTEPGEEVLVGEYYPMSVGDRWDYHEIDAYDNVETLRYEVLSRSVESFDNIDGEREVYFLENTWPENALRADEHRTQYIEDDGVRAVRLAHLIYDSTGSLTKERQFAPDGFLRLDRDKLSEGASWSEEMTRYTDTLDGNPVQEQIVHYNYLIESVHAEVTVPAGTFDCVQIRRTVGFGESDEAKVYYYAPDVGKVKEVTEGDKTEELADYQVTIP